MRNDVMFLSITFFIHVPCPSLEGGYNVPEADFICRYRMDRKSNGSFRYLQLCMVHYSVDSTHKRHAFCRIGKTGKCQVLVF